MGFTFISFEAVNKSSYKPNGRPRGRAPRNDPNETELRIRDLFISGETLKRIGELQTPIITRERVRQILRQRFGLVGKDGGKFKSCTSEKIAHEIKKIRIKKEKEEESCLKVFGCSIDVFLSINGEKWNRRKGTPAMAFYSQWHNAVHRRGIAWNITFPEWWKVWQDSGHYNERGIGSGYCMSRVGDTGGYEVGNVEIKTIGENFSESFLKHPASERRATAIKNGKIKSKKG